MGYVFVELGINPETAGVSPEPSTETVELVERYNHETMFVARLFTRYLSDWSHNNLQKILILIVNSRRKDGVSSANWITGVCVLYRYFDWSLLDNEKDQISRYKILLDFLFSALTEAAKKFGFPAEVFADAYARIIAGGYVNECTLLSATPSPDNIHSASVRVRLDKSHSTIFLEVADKCRIVQKTAIFKIAQHEDDFGIFVGNIKWLGNNELMISNKEDEIHLKYSLASQTAEIFFTPKIHEEQYLRDEIRLLNPDMPEVETLAIRKAINSSIRSRDGR